MSNSSAPADSKYTSSRRSVAEILEAAAKADWGQVVSNGGPPCFAVEHRPGRGLKFCLRAERWPGHGIDHAHVSLEDLIRTLSSTDPQGGAA